MADTSQMPISMTMAFCHDPDQPGGAGGGKPPQASPSIAGADREAAVRQDGITADRLKQVMWRLETGFYDAPQVREQIARRVRKELDP